MTSSRHRTELLAALPDPRDHNKNGADRLFEAVLCLLVERGAELMASALQPGDVADRAGKARASYYRTEGFPSAESVVGDADRLEVLSSTLNKVINGQDLEHGEVVTNVNDYLCGISDHTSFRVVVETIAHANFGAGDPYFAPYLLTAALAPSSDEICDILRRYFETVTTTYHESLERVMNHFGVAPMPPFSSLEVTKLMSALHDGIAMRGLVDDDANSALYAKALGAILGALVGAADGPERIAPTFDPQTDHYIGTSKSRTEILAEIRLFIDRHAPVLPELEEIGRAVGFSPASLTSLFGGLSGILAEVWSDFLPPVYEAYQRDRRQQGLGTAVLLQRHLARLATLAGRNPDLVSMLIRANSHRRSTANREHPGARPSVFTDAIVEQLLEELSNEGAITMPHLPGVGPDRGRSGFARHMLTALWIIVLDRSDVEPVVADDAEAAAAYVCDLFINR